MENFSYSSYCICHSIKSLLYEHGVSPTIAELDENPSGWELALVRLIGSSQIRASHHRACHGRRGRGRVVAATGKGKADGVGG
ncbi:hypothetical protein RJ639_013181 [Escallonia herrerae]|uniref:Uncharacterized protein n=1 Tax=Escallonia herrerae TaxID=1293975 RepID=A0AA88VIM2_9ASTE|nr:hypothetical protein RJ639_013181 [Escallonia herrerae]